ncbi:MAG: FG-GAP-like repeat-containing protein [Terriglobales bacterium]
MSRRRATQLPSFQLLFFLAGIVALLVSFAWAQTRSSKAPAGNFAAHVALGEPSATGGLPIHDAAIAHHFAGGLHSPEDSFTPPVPIFLQPVTYPAGDGDANSIAVADLNHDGKLDVVQANLDGLAVLLGNGDGSFQPPVTYNSGGIFVRSAQIADVNRDGKPDILALNQCASCAEPTVAVLLGNGDGTFQPAVTYSAGAFSPWAMVVADVNGDHKLDLVVANDASLGTGGPGVITVLLGNGDGTFQNAVAYDSGGYAASGVAVADVNGDGKPDLVVANVCAQSCDFDGEGAVGVLLGNGDGTFQPALSFDPLANDTKFVVAADLNGDGKLDLAVASCLPSGRIVCGGSPGVVSIMLGNGDGTFQPAATFSPSWVPANMVVADVNADGKPDLVVGDGGVDVFFGNGDGTFQAPFWYAGIPGTVNAGISSVAVVDINGDGRPDLVGSVGCGDSCDSSNTAVLLHTGNVATTTALTSTPNPAVFGQETFTVTVNSGSGIPTGNVIFYDETDGGQISSLVPLVNGTATISGVGYGVGVGTNAIAAVYQGSLTDQASLSNVVNQVVTLATTTTIVTPSQNPVLVNKKVVYTGAVFSQYLGPIGAYVACTDNGSPMESEKKHRNLFAKKYSTPGTHAIVCSFYGDQDNYGSTSATLNEQVVYATTTVVTTSGSPSQVGQPVTFTAVVSSKFGAIPDGELVTFTYSGKLLGTAPLSGGITALTTAVLPKGKHAITATYAGDASFKTSFGRVTQVVEK